MSSSSSSRAGSYPPEEITELPQQLSELSTRIDEKPESFATGNEDIRLAALKATKYVFDLALQTESKSRAQITELLEALAPSHAPKTRSQAKAAKSNVSEKVQAAPTLQEAPIYELSVDGMDDEQIWAQLELRAKNLADVLEYALEGTGVVPESDEESEGSSIKRRKGLLGLEDGDLDMDANMEMDLDADEDSEDEDMDSEDEEEDDEEENDDEDENEEYAEEDYGEDVTQLRDPSDEDDDVDLDAPSLKKRRGRGKKGKGHPELDDGFFDLSAFNAETEEAEARASSRGKLGRGDGSDDEDADLEDVDLFTSVNHLDENDLDEEPESFYNDFFAPPSKVVAKGQSQQKLKTDSPKKAGVRFHDEVRVKNIKAKGKSMSLSAMYDLGEDDSSDEKLSASEDEYEDEEAEDSDSELEDEDEEHDIEADEEEDVEMASQSEDNGEDTRETIERLKDDLFADENDDEPQIGLSSYEKRMASLREEITALEGENVATKHWTLMGEATTRSRPQNALLEEDLEFERVMKAVPVITEETVQGLEERIKARIVQNQFDDVVRKRPMDDKPFLPSRFFELQDTKSKQSLAEIYEDEYTAAKSGGAAGEDRDGKLKKEHAEIEKLWDQICSKLDALCNAHFTPKAPNAAISTIANVSTATVESALPTTKAVTTMLAPEEVFAPQSAQLKARSELTPAEKHALHNKQKKANKKARSTLDQSVNTFSKAKGIGGVKKQKEAALKSVVKSGKGVTVIGKKSKKTSS
ncbi:hypothetical protein PHLGIDRAFT_10298 [Phlebiopsis gigantea 11061_1 CR5-6]|uniref:U3 small nucleolar ribonucleoprotein protein MPP10 n=1 Tax=Phlebiopsis gigantea (strain 11061_1 CR5-6) TaxID=745531 RepID=A0A0C3SDM7_PHLG1|nr:hypothetical protein PHLGIDRAFT_10298 [Phlebiopsis gigantea 11061_1 CR5-6]